MFKFFESWTTALPEKEIKQPPTNLFAFCWHYTKDYKVPLSIMAFLRAVLAILEVSLFGFMGDMVDVLNNHTP